MPFTKSQIDAVVRSVDSNKTADHSGYYILTKHWIVEHLAITEEEANSIGFSTYINKREKTKQKNRQNKQERNTKIIEMHSGGVVHSDIAKALGISLRTVQTVIKDGLVKKSAVEKHTKMLQVVRRTMFSEVERSGTEENMVARRRQAAARIARLRYTTGGNPSGFAV